MTRTGDPDNVMNHPSPSAASKQYIHFSLQNSSIANSYINNNYQRNYYKDSDYDNFNISKNIEDSRWNNNNNNNNKKRHIDILGIHKGRFLLHQHPLFPHGYIQQSHITPPDRFLSKYHLFEVREVPANLTNGSKWDQLSLAMWKKFLMHRQTEEVYKNKISLWKDLFVRIKSWNPRHGLFLVGSTLTGFGGISSDVDMCLIVRHPDTDQRRVALAFLPSIHKLISTLDNIVKAELIQAKVPILKFRDVSKGLEVDLNCNNSVGIRNTHLLYCYSQLDWRVRPLVIVVKLWAHFHNINDAKNMTISSYSLTLMVIHFLQYGVKPVVLPCLHSEFPDKFCSYKEISKIEILEDLDPYYSLNTMTIGELLVTFFEYYSVFNFSKNAISVRVGSVIPIEICRQVRTMKNDPHQWKYLCIEEPFDLTNTARSVYDKRVFERILFVFQKTAVNLRKSTNLESIFKRILPTFHFPNNRDIGDINDG